MSSNNHPPMQTDNQTQATLSDYMMSILNTDPGEIDESIEDLTLNEEDHKDMELAMLNMLVRHKGPEHKVIPRNFSRDKLLYNKIPEYQVQYAMTEEQFDYLQRENQHLYLRYEPRHHHDHPLSHEFVTLNERKVIESYNGALFVDLHGNSNRNSIYKLNSLCYKGIFSPKDYLRRINAKPTDREFISYDRLVKETIGIQYYLSVHSMYYMDIEDIATIVYGYEGNVFDAIIHRHNRINGKINGECEYKVDLEGIVTHTTPLGEEYRHPTLEPYFNQWSAKTSKGVITWTASKLGGDTYKLRFVACPGYTKDVPKLDTPKIGQPKAPKVLKEIGNYQLMEIFGYKWIQNTAVKDMVLDDLDFYRELVRFIGGRERKAQSMRDLQHYARRLTDSKDLFAKHGDVHYQIPPEQVMSYVCAAFYDSVQHEVDVMLTYRREYKNAIELHNKLLSDLTFADETAIGKLTKSISAGKKLVDLASKQVNDKSESAARYAGNAISHSIYGVAFNNIVGKSEILDYGRPKGRIKSNLLDEIV